MGTFLAYEVPGIHTGPDDRRYPHGAPAGSFAPQYLCLVYLKFEPGGIVARHAYFPLPANLPVFAAVEFAAVAATGQWSATAIREEVHFENFTFGSQQLIVFHIDPAGAPVRLDPRNLTQFAEFSAEGQPREPNNSFLNPRIQTWGGLEMLVLENWFVDADGQPVTTPLWYAMNVHLLMRCALDGHDDRVCELPLILDPDTGNGAGNEP